MVIDSEVLTSPSGLVLYTDSITNWEPPDDHEIVNQSTRVRIVENIREAFRFRGVEIEIR